MREHLGDPTFVPRPGVGIAVGSLTSQFWANAYLDALDHFIKRTLKVPGYCRFMDNLTLFGPSRGALRVWRREVEVFVRERLGLRLSPREDRLRPTSAKVTYLGYEITRHYHSLAEPAFYRFSKRLEALATGGPLRPEQRMRLERSMVSFRGLLSF